MKAVLVTGGAGYVGSHVCKALARAGYDPISIDDMSTGNPWAVKWGPVVTMNINRRAALESIMRLHKPVAVMHLAASSEARESVTNPGKFYRNNVFNTLNLLEVMRDCGVKHLVFSSSAAVYGDHGSDYLTEDAELRPVNPYGRTKLACEWMMQDFDVSDKVRSISLRYFNAAGADPEGELGEARRFETHLIPIALDVARRHKRKVMVYGGEHDTPDGTCVRDYVHVSDIADAHILAMRALLGGHATDAYNLSNLQGYSVYEVINMVREISGATVPNELSIARPGDPATLLGDPRKALHILGWSPRFQNLKDIIQTAWDWKVKNGHL